MPKKKTYGFANKKTAEDLSAMVGGGNTTYREDRSRQQNRLVHVKTKATCAARNNTTGAMTSVSCDRYDVATDGTVSDAGYDIDVWNPGGAIASGAWGTVLMNEAGLYEFVVVKCA